MTRKRRLFALISAAAALAFASAAIAAYRAPSAQSLLVGFSSAFREVQPDLFVSASADDAVAEEFVRLTAQARKRIDSYWQLPPHEGRSPTIVYCDSPELLRRFNSGRSASAHKTPFGCVVVIGPELFNVDVLSHELMHAELLHRVGFFKSYFQVPIWFDEGIALQVDWRAPYSEESVAEHRLDFDPTITLDSLSSPRGFWNGNVYHHYLMARHAVRQWLGPTSNRRLALLLERMAAGDTFAEAFAELAPPSSANSAKSASTP